MGDFDSRTMIFHSLYKEADEEFVKGNLQQAAELCHALISIPELPVYIRANCCLILAGIEDNYVFWAQAAVDEWQYGIDSKEEGDDDTPEQEQTLRNALADAQEILSQAKKLKLEEEGGSKSDEGENSESRPSSKDSKDSDDFDDHPSDSKPDTNDDQQRGSSGMKEQ